MLILDVDLGGDRSGVAVADGMDASRIVFWTGQPERVPPRWSRRALVIEKTDVLGLQRAVARIASDAETRFSLPIASTRTQNGPVIRDLVPSRVENLVPYTPGKPIAELERELGIQGAIKLASNENPYGAAPEVQAAMAKALQDLGSYPDGAAYDLRSAIAAHHGVSFKEVVTGNGSNELIDLICRAYPSDEDHVVFGEPSFVCYRLGCMSVGVDFTAAPMRDHLAWDVDALLAAVRPETKVLFVANPNNPTGAYMGRVELERLIRELPPRVVLVLDEAYVEFADANDYESALNLREKRERLLILRTFSKAYGLAALRVGYAIGPANLIDYLHRMRSPFNVNTLGHVGAIAALREQSFLQRYVKENIAERGRTRQALLSLGLQVAPSQANFVLTEFPLPGQQIYERLLREGVIVRLMGKPIESWLRITIGKPDQNDRMVAAVRSVLTEA